MASAIHLQAKATTAISLAHSFMPTPSDVRKTDHSRGWSYYIVLTSAILASITAVATAILGQFVIAIVTGILSLSSFFAAYQINNLRLMKNLEGYVAQLAQKTETLGNLLTALQKSEADLGVANNELNRDSARYKETAEREKVELSRRLADMSQLVRGIESDQVTWEATNLRNKALIAELRSNEDLRLRELDRLAVENKSLRSSVEQIQLSQQALGKGVASNQLVTDGLEQEIGELDRDLARGSEAVSALASFKQQPTANTISTLASALSATDRDLARNLQALGATAGLFKHVVDTLEERRKALGGSGLETRDEASGQRSPAEQVV